MNITSLTRPATEIKGRIHRRLAGWRKREKTSSPGETGFKPGKVKRAVPAVAPLALPSGLRQKLVALRRRRWVVGVLQGGSMLLASICALGTVQCLCDWWFDIPWSARLVFLALDLALLSWIYRNYLHGSLRKRVSLPFVALLVEKKWPQLRQTVVTATELAEGTPGSARGSLQLVNILLQQAQARTVSLDFSEIVPTRPMLRWLLAAGTLLLTTGAAAFTTFPASLVLVERMLLSVQPLPTRTIVQPLTRDLAVAFGTDVVVGAFAQGEIPRHGRVVIIYADEPPMEYPLDLVPNRPATFSFTIKNVQKPFKYRFYLNDGHGPEFTVLAEAPPEVKSLQCRVTYPDYTGKPPEDMSSTSLSLLAGSHLHLEIEASQALDHGDLELQGTTPAQHFPLTLDGSGLRLEGDLAIPVKDLTGFSVQLVNRSKIPSTNNTVYPITLVPDHPPVIAIQTPVGERETIVNSAQPILAFDVKDDFGVAQIAFCYQLIPPTVNGEVVSPPSSVFRLPFEIKGDKRQQHIEHTIDVGTQKPAWKEGWTINYWIEATDNNTATGPSLTKSDVKQFGVVTAEQKTEEILESVKQAATGIRDLSTSEGKVSSELSNSIQK